MTHHSVQHEIESDNAQHRAGLAATLAALRQRAAPEAMTNDAMGLFAQQAEYATGFVDRAMRANPVAFALMGAGVAWLLLRRHIEDGPVVPEKLVVMSSWEDDGGPARPSDELSSSLSGIAKSEAPKHSAGIIGDHPLLVGGVVLALGAAVGAAFPLRARDELIG